MNSALGETCARELARFEPLDGDDGSGGVVAPLPGRVVAVLVAAGDTVAAGDELVVLEAMKVEHRLSAPGAGVVSAVLVAVGDTVDAHAPLVHLATEATDTEPTDAGPSDTGPATTTPPQERRDES
ncbi:MAG: acetyl-CoA carboxylase biotin carboxyl carrier protein subunit [Acidimicrobiales bacterium]